MRRDHARRFDQQDQRHAPTTAANHTGHCAALARDADREHRHREDQRESATQKHRRIHRSALHNTERNARECDQRSKLATSPFNEIVNKDNSHDEKNAQRIRDEMTAKHAARVSSGCDRCVARNSQRRRYGSRRHYDHRADGASGARGVH